MTNEDELIHNHTNSKISIPIKTLYGSKYLLSLINLILICVVIILCIVSTVLFCLPPAKGITTTHKVIGSQDDNTAFTASNPIDAMFTKGEKQSNEDYSIISTKNVFSPDRKEWATKPPTPEPVKVPEERFPKKPSLARKTTKFILHGIIITGNIKKALIKNPTPGLTKKTTLYVEEGDEIEGYRVTSIESNQIRLDWHGEEIIVELYSGLEDINKSETTEILETPPENEGLGENKRPDVPETKTDFRKKRLREDRNPFADIK
jgi:hypothetical protein